MAANKPESNNTLDLSKPPELDFTETTSLMCALAAGKVTREQVEFFDPELVRLTEVAIQKGEWVGGIASLVNGLSESKVKSE